MILLASQRNLKWGNRLILLVCSFVLISCQVGGEVIGSTNVSQDSDQIIVTQPTIALPALNPYYSRTSSVTITGTCMLGNTVYIQGAAQDQVQCTSSIFSFTVNKAVDGIYNYLITQENAKGQFSKPTGFVWIRKTSVSQPIISDPVLNPFLSSTSSLLIKGFCESGATISLTGDGVGSTVCANSEYQINLIKSVDGNYAINVLQTDQAGNTALIPLVWNKALLIATPAVASVPVDTLIPISAIGGSGVYTYTLETNASGGTLDLNARTYRTGPLANVIDRIRVNDSVGSIVYMNITTVAGVPDHLVFESDSGNEQSQSIGLDLTYPLKVKVTDAFGNGISNYPLYFQTISGNHEIVSSSAQFSNLQGVAQLTVRAGADDVISQVRVGPFLSILPDVNNSDSAILTYKQYSVYANKGAMGSTFSLGQNPTQVISRDINGDGRPDLIILNSSDPSIGIMLSAGGGLYLPMTKVNPICNTPNALEIADVNEDSRLDLTVTCGNSLTTSMQVFTGLGDGSFNSAVNILIDPNEYIPTGLAIVDVDLDGHLDLVSTAAGSAMIFVRRGNVNGTFTAPVSYSVGGSPSVVKSLKVNNDSFVDLVVLNSGDNNATVLLNNGFGVFTPLQVYDTGAGPINMVTADFNSDGYDDIAVVNNIDSSITVLMNTTSNDFYESVNLASGVGTNAMVALDFDKDNKIDLAVTNGSDNTVSIFKGAGTGQFTAFEVVPVGTYPAALTAGDFNADTFSDLIVINNGVRLVQMVPNQSGVSFGYVTQTMGGPTGGAALRLNTNGFMDMAIINATSKVIEIFEGKGNGLFSSLTTLNTFDASTKIITADIRNNSRKDIIVNQPNFSKVRVFLSQATGGGFDLPIDYTVGTTPSAILILDINEDGKLDLIVTNSGTNNVSVLLGIGDGTFQNKIDFQVGDSPSAISYADFNLDHRIDLVVTNKNSGSISILLGNGNGSFQTQVNYQTGMSPVAMRAVDVNHDGCVDVVTTNNGDSTVAVLKGRCDGSFQSALFYSAGTNPEGLASGDFNGDNFLDFAVINSSSQSVTMLYSNSIGQFNSTVTLTMPGNITSLFSIDVNKDTATDLIIIDQNSNTFETLLGH